MPIAELKLKESNLAGIGSDLDAGLRKAAAESVAEFDGAGGERGLEIWRIEKFAPKKLAPAEHGTFYSGDAYVSLYTHTPPGSDTLAWDLHFWLGRDSTQDERGTAAYMTVNLDDKLGGKPVQFREVQSHETKKFLSHFPVIRYLDGGVDSGFTAVEPESYKPRLLHIFGPSGAVRVAQVPLEAASLNKSDVFILDAGLTLFQWNAPFASPFEKMRASAIREKLQAERDGEPKEVIIDGDEIEDVPQVWELLGGRGRIAEEGARAADVGHDAPGRPARRLYRCSDESGGVEVTLVAEGEAIDRTELSGDDVSVVVSQLGSGTQVYFSAGSQASLTEKFYLAFSADKILEAVELPPFTPISTVSAECRDEAFNACFK
jgi:gelsolin